MPHLWHEKEEEKEEEEEEEEDDEEEEEEDEEEKESERGWETNQRCPHHMHTHLEHCNGEWHTFGVSCFLVSPWPSLPESPEPQVQTERPSIERMMVCAAPHATCRTGSRFGTFRGVFTVVSLPLPWGEGRGEGREGEGEGEGEGETVLIWC